MALSDQLMDLANRTARLEDAAEAAREQDRQKLESERKKLDSSIQTQTQKMQEAGKQAGMQVSGWWADTTARMEEQRAGLRAKIQQRQAEHKVEQAQRNADDAEAYATTLMEMAGYVTDAAEYAAVEAVLARAEANELAASTQ